MRLLIAAVVGLLLGASSWGQDKGHKPAPEEREYAKVELKGPLSANPPFSQHPVMYIRGHLYELDLSRQKELQGDGWRKLEGKTVIVTGALILPTKSMKMPRVEVSSLRLIEDQ